MLTKKKQSVIITKLSQTARKKEEKRRLSVLIEHEAPKKRFKKNQKNLLTKRNECDIIKKSLNERKSSAAAKDLEN